MAVGAHPASNGFHWERQGGAVGDACQCSRRVQVDLPGGPLLIEWSEADNHVYMTGPAELVFQGSVEV